MMTAIECPTSQDLKALTLGQLSGEDSEVLFQHLSECEVCRSELETVEDTDDSLLTSLRSPDPNSEIGGEPGCQLAVAKALGALASGGQSGTIGEFQPLPSSIGEYEIVRPIGRGGMGNVYLARHTKLGREVALKVLASHRLADARMRDRFEAEMLAVGRLSHPNIVTAHDAREVNGTAVLVTEFVSGMDLGQLLQRTGPLSVQNACEIARQIALALSYTHQQGFVHRDIKPSNVMLSASGEVKLLDLGLARLQYGETLDDEVAGVEMTGTGQAMGTADYVAPEQVTDSRTVDIRADIYSLGCTLFKLLTGRAPFADERHTTAFAKMTAHVSKSPPNLTALLPEVPRGLANLIDLMLVKDPSGRPQTPRQVIDRLVPFCKGHDLAELSLGAAQLEPKLTFGPLSATSSNPVPQPWMRRKVPASVAIAAGLFGVVLGMILSIIIVITNPDGTKSILELAKGSTVEIKEGGSADTVAEQNGQVVFPDQPVAADMATPLSFGILVNPESTVRSPWISDVALAEATKLLHASNGESAVLTEHGTWLQVVPDDLSAPIKMQNAGKSFALVSNEMMIHWTEIKGHVTGTQVSSGPFGEAPLQMRFDQELGGRFSKLTRPNIRNQMAIIVNGEIRVAPFINSEIGTDVAITGVFKPAEIRHLEQLLFGSLVYPLQKAAPDVEDGSSNHSIGPAPGDAPGEAPDEAGSGTSELVTIAYQFSDQKMNAKLAIDVLSTLLAGEPDVRLAFDETSGKLVALARPDSHDLIKRTLAELYGDGDEILVPEQAFNGVWRIQEVTDGGTTYPVNPLQQPAAVFHDGQLAIFRDNNTEDVGTFTIRSLTPDPENGIYPQIKIESSLNTKVMVGIFSFPSPNELMICLNESGTEVPTLFLSMEDSPNDLLLKMQRVKLPNDSISKDSWLADPTNATVAKAFETLDAWRQGKLVQ